MTSQDREAIRHVVREAICVRFPNKHPVAAIRRRVETQLDFKIVNDDVHAALELLRGVGQAEKEIDPLGSTEYWGATSEGVFAWEREGN